MSIYDDLGVTTVINAQGHVTHLGGSLMEPDVMAAMAEAARAFVRLDDLQRKAGDRIAHLIGVESCYVSAGAAAGLAIATAAVLAGTDPARIAQLPDTSGLKNEVIVQRSHRNRYDHALRQVGGQFVEIGEADGASVEEMERVLSDRTALAFYVPIFAARGGISLRAFVEVAHRHDVPVLVDAAAEVPPAENLHAFYDEGADLIVFSGGKGLHGPQVTGLVTGRRRYIEACVPNGSPHHSVGRPMKVGKEEIVGLVRAVERYLSQDHASILARREEWTAEIVRVVAAYAGVKARAEIERAVPIGIVEIDAHRAGVSAPEVAARLQAGVPPIYVGERPGTLLVSTRALKPGEAAVVAARIGQILAEARIRGEN